jgi:PKD repeat protein
MSGLKRNIIIFTMVLMICTPLIRAQFIAPPNPSNGRWRPESARNLDRLLIMRESELATIKARIFTGDPIFKDIYSSDFNNRDGNFIGGIYQNATRTPIPTDRTLQAVFIKNKAFVALMGIGVQDGQLYEMEESERNLMRDEVLALLRNFDYSVSFSYFNRFDLQFRSRELMCLLEAYDMLRPVGEGRVWEESIVRQLLRFAADIYYEAEVWGASYSYNNHRIISGAALGMAAILFGDWGTSATDFSDLRERSYMPLAWIGYAMIKSDSVLYNYQVFPDGGYNEGPHYLRYGFVYALPFFKAMKIFGEVHQISDPGQSDGDWIEEYTTAPNTIKTLRSPWFGRVNNAHPDLWDILDWITKIRQPEGRVPGIADTFNDTYFPETSIVGGYYFWPQASYISGITDQEILNWALSTYADSRVDFIAAGNSQQESPPSWDKLQVFEQTGDIVFRSGWGLNDMYLHLYARDYVYGILDYHRGPHLQDDNSSFLLSYNKQVLALDCGFISWGDRDQVADAEHHNLILVNGQGPSRNSTTAQIEQVQSGSYYNYARIRTDYESATIRRGFTFFDNRYFIIKDITDANIDKRFQWLLHGNDRNPINGPGGVIWQKEDAVLQAFITTNGGKQNLDYVFSDQIHDNGYGPYRTETHKLLSAGRTATDMQYLSILFPYGSDLQVQPEIEDIPDPSFAAVFVDRTLDPDFGNRYEIIVSQWSHTATVNIPQNQYGTNNRTIEAIKTDADFLVLSFDPENPDDPNRIKYFPKGMSMLDYGEFVLFPQFAPRMSAIGNYVMSEMTSLEVTISATDTNGHYLSFSSPNLPSFAQLIDNGDGTGVIQFTPGYLDAGTYNNIQILVEDSGTPKMSDQKTFDLTVQNVNLNPIANATSNISIGTPPMYIDFSGEGSNDLDGTIQSYEWNFGDGNSQSTQDASYTYDIAGKYYVIFTVTDNDGATDSDTLIIINHANLTELFISEASYTETSSAEYVEIYNNAPYAINLREFKLIQIDAQGDVQYIFDFGEEVYWPESTTIVPAKQTLVVGRGIPKSFFVAYWDLSTENITYNLGSYELESEDFGDRWQLRYFNGIDNQYNGTLIDDTEQIVAGFLQRSYQSRIGLWIHTSFIYATPGYLDPYPDQSLPVGLIALDAVASENSISIQWETQSELNNIGYIILKSTGEDDLYEQIASYQTDDDLLGLGSSAFGKKYQYDDLNVERNVTYWYKLVDVDFDGKQTHHGPVKGKIIFVADNLILKGIEEIPQQFMLYDNFPNPFNMTTSIRFDIPDIETGNNIISISIYNIQGKKVNGLYSGPLSPGGYQLQWDGKNDAGNDMASGLYILSLQSPSFFSSKKMILLR